MIEKVRTESVTKYVRGTTLEASVHQRQDTGEWQVTHFSRFIRTWLFETRSGAEVAAELTSGYVAPEHVKLCDVIDTHRESDCNCWVGAR